MCPHCEYSCITKRNLDRHIVNNHIKRRRIQIDDVTGQPIMAGGNRRRVKKTQKIQKLKDKRKDFDDEELYNFEEDEE